MAKSHMKRVINNNQGFTLLEFLLVLSIIGIMTIIVMPIGQKWIYTTAEEDAINSIITTVYALQSYSMANQAYTRLSFRKEGSRTMYIAATTDGQEFSRKLLPEGMTVASSGNIKSIDFHANGDIVNFGTIIIIRKSSRTKITFQFQRGRVIISE